MPKSPASSQNRTGPRPSALDAAIRALLRHQFEDATRRLSDSYWSHNGHNVGSDVANATYQAVAAIAGVFETDPEPRLQALIDAVSAAREHYRRSDPDPDGYGSATLAEIIRDLTALRSRHRNARPSRDCLDGLEG